MVSSSEEKQMRQAGADTPKPRVPTPTEPDDEIDNEEIKEEEEEEDDGEEEEGEDDEGERPLLTGQSRVQSDRAKMETLFRRLAKERVPVRVHDVLIKGNSKTKDFVIEAQVAALKNATTMQELLQASSVANAKLQGLEVFDSVTITLDSGPPELPGTTNVVVEVVEAKSPLTGDFGIFTKPEVQSYSNSLCE